MMEPVSIIGVVSSVFGVAEIVAKSVKGLVNLQATYKSADLLVTIIVGHLSTVQAILDEIRDWLEQLEDESEHAVLLDRIDMAVGCCAIIAEVLFEKIDGLRHSAAQKLTMRGKLLYMLGESSIKDMNAHLSTQVQALHILVDAARCKTSRERNNVLNNIETRSILQQIQDDSRSHIHAASEIASVLSRRSYFSENSYLSNIDFEFDAAVLSSQVYRNALGPSNHQQSEHYDQQLTQRLRRRSSTSTVRQTTDLTDAAGRTSITSGISSTEPGMDTDVSNSRSDEMVSEEPATRPLNTLPLSTRVTTTRKKIEKLLLRPASGAPENLRRYWSKQASSRLSTTIANREPNHSRVRSLNLLFRPKVESKEDREARLCDEAITAWLKGEHPIEQHPIEHTVLILGSSESGKSTLFKSLELHFNGVCTNQDREDFREVIWRNTMISMQVVLEAMESLELPLDNSTRETYVQTVFMQSDPLDFSTALLKDCKEAIVGLRDDSGVKECIARSREYQLADCAAYCFANAERILDPDFVPTDEDILRSRVKTLGFTETRFQKNGEEYHIFDVGGARSERRKWPIVFRNATCILFTVDISNYDRLLWEDKMTNRMQDQLALFDSIVNSKWFIKTDFVLLFTKIDCLMQKLQISPMSNYFPDYAGTGLNQAADYLRDKFLSLVQDKEKLVYPYYCTFLSDNGSPKFDFKVIDKIVSRSRNP